MFLKVTTILFALLIASAPVLANKHEQLIEAIENNKYSKAVRLIKRGANVNYDPQSGDGPLMTAANYKRFKILRYLLKKGANAKVLDFYGSSALHKITEYPAPNFIRAGTISL